MFLVDSADRRFVELTTLGRCELLVWDGQPVAVKLADLAHQVHRVSRPTAVAVDLVVDEPEPSPTAPDSRGRSELATVVLTAVAAGVGLLVDHRLSDALLGLCCDAVDPARPAAGRGAPARISALPCGETRREQLREEPNKVQIVFFQVTGLQRVQRQHP